LVYRQPHDWDDGDENVDCPNENVDCPNENVDCPNEQRVSTKDRPRAGFPPFSTTRRRERRRRRRERERERERERSLLTIK